MTSPATCKQWTYFFFQAEDGIRWNKHADAQPDGKRHWELEYHKRVRPHRGGNGTDRGLYDGGSNRERQPILYRRAGAERRYVEHHDWNSRDVRAVRACGESPVWRDG